MTGCQRPRYSWVPDRGAPWDLGEFAEIVGVRLDDWQRWVLAEGLRSEGGRWVAREVGLLVPRQNGKSLLLLMRALAGLLLCNERLVIYAAHELKTAREVFLQLQELVEGSRELRSRVSGFRRTNGEEALHMKGGARLRFLARSRGSGRGFSADCVLLDEAYALQEAHMAAIWPTISARPDAQVWYASSAGMRDSLVLRRLRDRGRAGGEPGYAYFEWCASEDSPVEVGVAEANPALGLRLDPQVVWQERAAMEERLWRRERLGVWEDEEPVKPAVDPALWARLAEPDRHLEGPLVGAVDASPDRRCTSVVVSDGRGVIVSDYRVGEPPDWAVGVIVSHARERGVWTWVVDAGSAAGVLVSRLRDAGVEVVTPSMRMVATAWGGLRDAVTSGGVWHRGQPMLDAAVGGAVERPLGELSALGRAGEVDISPLVAASLALWGWRERVGESRLLEAVW